MSVRETLVRVAAERGESLSGLSLKPGRNQAYLSQFVHRNSPRTLPEQERRHLAMALNLDETLLGAREPWRPSRR